MLVDIVKSSTLGGAQFLEISYWNQDGRVVTKKKEIYKDDLFNWKNSDRKTDKIDYLGKYVKKAPIKNISYMSRERVQELIEVYFKDILDDIYSINQPMITFFDIETEVIDINEMPDMEKAECAITTISFLTNKKLFVLGWKPMSESEIEKADNLIKDHLKKSGCHDEYVFKYKCFGTESEMLEYFIYNVVKKTGLLTGWNSNKFDWPYICYRCKRLNIVPEIKNGNFKKAQDGMLKGVHLPHTMQFDYIIAFQTWARKYIVDNYRLDTVGEAVAGIKKIAHTESFMELYNNSYAKYVAYNAIDSVVVQQIHNVTKSLTTGIGMSSLTRSKASESATRSLLVADAIRFYYAKEGRVIPVVENKNKKESSYEGAFFKQPVLGKHFYCMACDFASLYPNIMRQFNISPETYVRQEERGGFKEIQLGFIRCASGAVYKKEEGVLPKMLKDLYLQRKGYKKVMEIYKQKYEEGRELMLTNPGIDKLLEYYNKTSDVKRESITVEEFKEYLDELYKQMHINDDKQWAAKTIINATYGAFGFESFRFFDINIAESITLQGKDCILYVEKLLNEMFKTTWQQKTDVHKKMNTSVIGKVTGNVSVYIATDSIYYSVYEVINSTDWMKNKVWKLSMNEYSIYCSAKGLETEEQALKFFKEVQNENIEGYKSIELIDPDPCYFAMCLYRVFLKDFFKEVLADYSRRYNANGELLNFEFESYCHSGIWTGKNRYVQDIRWTDPNVYYQPYTKIKSTGLENIKSTYTKFLRDLYSKTLLYSLKLGVITPDNIIEHLREMKKIFMQAPITDICELSSLNTYEKYVISDTGNIHIMNKTPPTVKGAVLWNYLISKKPGLSNRYSRIKDGDKVRMAILKNSRAICKVSRGDETDEDMIDVLAFSQDTEVNERTLMDIGATIDREAMFEKLYLAPVNRILTSCHVEAFDASLTYQGSLFL